VAAVTSGKRITLSARPSAHPRAEAWVRQRDEAGATKSDLFTARLTIDVTPALRARIKVAAFTQGMTVAETLRVLLQREFPEKSA
jgi:hypothetical protein